MANRETEYKGHTIKVVLMNRIALPGDDRGVKGGIVWTVLIDGENRHKHQESGSTGSTHAEAEEKAIGAALAWAKESIDQASESAKS